MMNTKLLGIFASLALIGLTAQASATVVDITYTGQVFGGTANDLGTFCGVECTESGYTWTGQEFSLTYTFDTSLPGTGTVYGNGIIFLSITGPCPYIGCESTASFSTTSQSMLFEYSSSGYLYDSVTTELFGNPAIPSDITAPYALSGPDIGSGSFSNAASPGALCGTVSDWQCTSGTLQIESVTANGGLGATPLPAALPLFATGLGVMGLFGWRRKRKFI
jgi:hypothetical protein